MSLIFLHCCFHILSSRHLTSLLVTFRWSIDHCFARMGFLSFWIGRPVPLLSLPLVAEFLTFYIFSSYNSPDWLLKTSFVSQQQCYSSSLWLLSCHRCFLRTLRLLHLLSLLHSGSYTKTWPLGRWGDLQTRWGDWAGYPRGLWADFLTELWGSQQDPHSFNARGRSYLLPALSLPSLGTKVLPPYSWEKWICPAATHTTATARHSLTVFYLLWARLPVGTA